MGWDGVGGKPWSYWIRKHSPLSSSLKDNDSYHTLVTCIHEPLRLGSALPHVVQVKANCAVCFFVHLCSPHIWFSLCWPTRYPCISTEEFDPWSHEATPSGFVYGTTKWPKCLIWLSKDPVIWVEIRMVSPRVRVGSLQIAYLTSHSPGLGLGKH